MCYLMRSFKSCLNSEEPWLTIRVIVHTLSCCRFKWKDNFLVHWGSSRRLKRKKYKYHNHTIFYISIDTLAPSKVVKGLFLEIFIHRMTFRWMFLECRLLKWGLLECRLLECRLLECRLLEHIARMEPMVTHPSNFIRWQFARKCTSTHSSNKLSCFKQNKYL